MKAFPVDGRATFSNDFGADHHGIDIFAASGTPVVAVDDGTIRVATEFRGGLVAYLRTAGGVTYYYAHLERYIGSFPRAVRAGESIGTVGNTGNAFETEAHVHFEMRSANELFNPYDPLARAFNSSNTSGKRWPLILGISAVATAAYYLASRL